MNIAAFEMLIATIGAAGCWFLWFYFIKEYRIANFRERLFSLREELFQSAAEGHVSFDDPAYVELRVFINGILRFAHRVTFLTLIISVRNPSTDNADQHPYQRWKESLECLAPDSKKRLELIHSKVFSAFMEQLVSSSVALFAVSVVLRTGFFLRSRLAEFFSAKESETSPKMAMERNLAQTINAQSLVEVAYREGKASEKMELSLA